MIASILTCGLLVSACMWLHYVVLRRLWAMTKVTSSVNRPMLKILFTLFGLHLFEVVLYAIAISVHEMAGLGSLSGAVDPSSSWLENHIYFSIASYTTLGIGDILPHGTLRLVSGVEALNGLILIAWSASFTYLVMERFWGEAHSSGNEQD